MNNLSNSETQLKKALLIQKACSYSSDKSDHCVRVSWMDEKKRQGYSKLDFE